jgi:hypothetical protein
MRAAALIVMAGLGLGTAGCTFPGPMQEVAAPGSPAERLERRERQDQAETDRILYCQRLDRDDPRWDRDCKNRR